MSSINISNSLSYASSLSASLSGSKAVKSSDEAEKTSGGVVNSTAEDTDADATAEAASDNDADDSGSALDAKSILEDFRKSMNDQLLKSMGLGSTDELAAAMSSAGISSLSISVQFELNYQSVSSVSGAATGTSMSLSLSASFELAGISSGNGSGYNPFATDAAGSADGTSGASDLMSTLADLFSPEKTAQRILDFSLGFFGQSSQFEQYGDTEEGRGAFADMMGAAIQKGFDQALGILGDLPEQTSNEIDQTHQLVFGGLDDFVKNGRDSSRDDVYSQIQNYVSAYQYSASYSSLSTTVNTANGSQTSSSVNYQASYQQVQSSYSSGSAASSGGDSSSGVTA